MVGDGLYPLHAGMAGEGPVGAPDYRVIVLLEFFQSGG